MEEKLKVDIKQLVAEAVAKFREDYAAKSFSQRNPELGRMIKCQICLKRHRSSIVCTQTFAVGTHDPAPEGEKTLLVAAQTRKGVNGAHVFTKKRIRSHHSHARLQLVQLTQDLFPKYFPDQIAEPDKAMKAARGEAQAILSRKSRALRRALVQQQHRSRQINLGLVRGGTR